MFGIQVEDEPTYNANCGTSKANILIAVFNPTTLERVMNISGGPYQQCGESSATYYHFPDIFTSSRQAQLTTFLNNVPEGYYVAAVSLNRVRFSTFPTTLKAALTSIGSSLINNLQDSDPFVILGQKGLAAGKAQEMTADLTSATPRYDQVITLNASMKTLGTSGVLISTRIGPAQNWGTLFHDIKASATGTYTLKVLGINAEGASQVLFDKVQSEQFSLSEVSAKDYPYLQLELQAKDEQSRKAPQLKQWLVTYQGFPEGLVRRDLATAGSYDATTLEKQAASGTITVPVVFQNVSTIDFSDKVKAVATVRNGNTVSPEITLTSPRILKADSTVTYLYKLDVAGLTGATSVHVDVNPKLLPELYYFNNQLDLNFNAADKNLPPTLDVAFDGQHILNGDIVSPSPIITAVLHDEDKVRAIKDPSNFQLLLTRPGGTVAERIDMNSPAVTFRTDAAKGTAQVEYRPEKLADGVYKLQVQGTDVNGTQAAVERYEVSFEVINASTITNVYPYPNPVTSKTRFVFTMTGAELPRDMKIQIMTLTGKVVREIMMAELGPLHIGNNISQFAWDGTDEFGDRLANGTYLYRVIMDQSGQFERRRTAGDKAFKKDWGKLVLLR
ncbi:interleukin-like EMT inducer domain-containing protein [Hymenobacter sp. DG25B]|uniref:interleukin-like EMT inducer domain-containing protein n=1 Tax=Hymenobacter sp. DG25B TaxID=1385664 RepID=UPI0009E4838C|nr:interleukin-like EMT inducer domain-containing protein [Hymenobacter sp. DG25B]